MDEGCGIEMDILAIIFRTTVIYLVILILFRMMGKREVGELSILDLVVSIMIGDIAVLSLKTWIDHFSGKSFRCSFLLSSK